jgi:3-deoxy-D-manno-octulosonic-acid transferase
MADEAMTDGAMTDGSATEPALPAELPRRVPRRAVLYVSLIAYQLFFFVAFFGFLVWRLVFDGRYRRGLPERLGFVRASEPGKRVVWIHGVSVGEVKAADTLIARLRETRPDLELVISSTTPTGYALAKILHPDLRVILYPLDLGPCPGMALRRIRPDCVLLMELEVWPNFLQATAGLDIPVAVINGRISEQSFRRYRMARTLLPQFNLIWLYCMQDEHYRERLLNLNVEPDRTRVTGNMKYDNVQLREPDAEFADVRRWLSADGRPVIVCGSTHGEEERWLASAVVRLEEELGIRVRTVLAPRHPERAPGVRDGLLARGMTVGMWSQQMRHREPLADDEMLIVDTIGHLEKFYGACDVAFVGGSLVRRGGQNMVEAAAMGKAVVFGPHVSNFRKDVHLLLEADAACQVKDLEDLHVKLRTLLTDAALRRDLGERAVALIQRNQGSTERTLAHLQPILMRAAPVPV